ncbi:MAG: hypothetical protein EOP06_24940 [Proteobacteria bacterium]|nr:MAG: hypothetical protein EOP06_24940 [Pseudomonadota bacterium]
MQIDHVFPEAVLDDKNRHAKILKEYGLDAAFDIQSIGNLAPPCADCNRRKSELPFTIGQIAIFLAQIKTALSRLEAAYSKAQSERRLSDIMRSITIGLKKPSFTKEMLLERVSQAATVCTARDTSPRLCTT